MNERREKIGRGAAYISLHASIQFCVLFSYRRDGMHACMILTPYDDIIVLIAKYEILK
jgi:hypothetical protein